MAILSASVIALDRFRLVCFDETSLAAPPPPKKEKNRDSEMKPEPLKMWDCETREI